MVFEQGEKESVTGGQTKQGLRVVIAGGGTGGHLYPGIAIAEAFQQLVPGTDIHFLGAEGGIESRVLPREGWNALFLDMARIRGGGLWVAAKGAFKVPLAVMRCMRFFLSYRPDLVVGVGGYASGAAMIAAFLTGTPRVVQEQNAVPGMTNKVAGRFANRVYTSFDEAEAHFPKGKVRCVGNPIRAAIRGALAEASQTSLEAEGSASRVLVFGGSQGARFLNQQVPGLLADVIEAGANLEIVHQTGLKEEEETRSRYEARGIQATVLPYIHDMAQRYEWADLAICRAGASTLAELTAIGLPALLIPFPYAAGDHQAANALSIAHVGGAKAVRQQEWDQAALTEYVVGLLADPAALAQMGDACRSMGKPEAADSIVSDSLTLIRRKGIEGVVE